MIRCVVYVMILIGGLSSCINNKSNDWTRLKSDKNIRHLSFQEMKIKPFIGVPGLIMTIDDCLLVEDCVDGKSLLLYNLADSSYVRALSIGQGPAEVLAPILFDVSEEDRTVYVLQRQNGECRAYPMDSLLLGNDRNYRKIQLGFESDRFVKTKDGYVGLGFYSEGMFRFLDNDGLEVGNLDPFPTYSNQNLSNKYAVFQGVIAYNPQSEMLMYAPMFASEILFYSKDNGHWTKASSFNIGDGKLESRIIDSENLSLKKDDRMNCISACSSEKYFYVLYSGETLGKTDKVPDKYVLRFHLNGLFDCAYEINPSVSCISVDSSDSTIYSIMLGEDGEYAIGKTSLPQNG